MTEADPVPDARIAAAVGGLVAFLRSAPPDVWQRIACGDSYSNAEDNVKHLLALHEVVTEFDCRLDRRPDSGWFPGEPVELVSYGVDGHDPLTVCVANALLMISDLEDGPYDHMRYRWDCSPGRSFFESLPDGLRPPIMAGFDLLCERWER